MADDTVTQQAILVHQQLVILYKTVTSLESQLSKLLRNPKIDMKKYYEETLKDER